MTQDELISLGILTKDGSRNPNVRFLEKSNPEAFGKLLSETAFLNEFTPSLAERVFALQHGLTTKPLCPICSSPIKFKSSYSNTCSYKCNKIFERNAIDPLSGNTLAQLRTQKVKESNNKIGADGLTGYQRGAKKIHEKLRKNIDGDTGKSFQTLRVEKAIETKRNTIIDGISQQARITEKFKSTMRNTLNEDGLNLYQQAAKKREKFLNELNEDGISNRQKALEKSVVERKKNYFLERIKDISGFTLLSDVELYINESLTKWQCHKCQTIFEHTFKNGLPVRCLSCDPIKQSQPEKDLQDFLASLFPNISLNDRNSIYPFELDAHLVDHHLAFEFNGVYWHSDKFKDTKYHKNKRELCEFNGIQLVQIFEHYWVKKEDIVKSTIKAKLGIFEKRIFARKCKIENVESSIANKFLNDNHIQGADRAKHRFGLYYNNELIAIMTFTKPRFNKSAQLELSRFCVLKNQQVIGGMSKLFKHAIKTLAPSSVISYVDLSLGSAANYVNNLGFTLDHISGPGYFYVKQYETVSRYQAQKHRLQKLLGEQFDQTKSEIENMKAAGYYRIFDAGHAVLVFRK